MEVFINILYFFGYLPLGQGFGLNTNILETNIINLSVVIAIVITFVGDALRSLLENRKQTVLNNLREADQRALEAKNKLDQAQSKLDLAQKKAIEIREQGVSTAEQEKIQFIRQFEKDFEFLKKLKEQAIKLQQQKVVFQISQQIIFLALQKVKSKLSRRLRFSFHSYVNNFNVVRLKNYKVK